MAKPIKETPVLYGEDAAQFLRDLSENAKRDHSVAYARAKTVFNRFMGEAQSVGHVHAHPR